MNKEDKIKQLYQGKNQLLRKLKTNIYIARYIGNVINMILYILFVYVFHKIVLISVLKSILLSFITSSIISIPIKNKLNKLVIKENKKEVDRINILLNIYNKDKTITKKKDNPPYTYKFNNNLSNNNINNNNNNKKPKTLKKIKTRN